MTVGNIILNTYEKQINKLIARTMVDNALEYNLLNLQFQLSYPTLANTFIRIEFPLKKMLVDTSLMSQFDIDLGSGLKHGYKINCLDKLGTMSVAKTYQCNLF